MNNVNDEDFANADTWLSEQFLNQLREFNNEFKGRLANNENMMTEALQNYPSTDLLAEYAMDTTAFATSSSRLDSFDVGFNRSLSNDNYGMKSELLDLSFLPVEPTTLAYDIAKDTGSDYAAEALDLSTAASSFGAVPALSVGPQSETAISSVTSQNLQDGCSPFGSAEEELQLLKFLEDHAKNSSAVNVNKENDNNDLSFQIATPNTQIIILPEVKSSVPDEVIIKCASCCNLFDAVNFQSHTCISTEPISQIPKTASPLVTPSAAVPSPVMEKEPYNQDTLLPVDPACIRLLKENQIRIRRFLKDELKYDVNAVSLNNSNQKTGSSFESADTGVSSNSETSNEQSSVTNGQQNTAIKKQEGPHECTLCERKFVHASGLLRHMEKHALDLIPTTNTSGSSGKSASTPNNSHYNINGLRVVIKCTLCGRIFFEQYSAFVHLCSHFPRAVENEQDTYSCVGIPYETYVDDALRLLQDEVNAASCSNDNAISLLREHKPPQYLKMVIMSCILQCEFCDFVFSEVSYLIAHSSWHLPERRFECFSCGIHVKSSKEICTHWQAECVFMRESLKIHQAITQRYFVCNVCENKFQSLDLLHEHRYTSYHFFPRLNKRFGTLQLPCEYCELLFENAHDCVSHYEEKHYRRYKRGERECVGGTSSKTRQYLCDICGKSYTQSSHLWQHLRFHQGVKPFACKEPGCTRKFTIRPDLNDHIRKCHTGERPYHCLICGKRFLTGSVFYQHRLIHRGERRYECEECGKRFYRADALKNHQRIHTGEKPFGCLFCTKNFRQRGDRDKHIRARHSHLDANARIMMQMQKLQLEAAASVQQQQQQYQQSNYVDGYMPCDDVTFDSFANLQSSTTNIENIQSSSSLYNAEQSPVSYNNNNDVITIGNVAFPKTMIETLMLDINEETVLKVLQLNTASESLNVELHE